MLHTSSVPSQQRCPAMSSCFRSQRSRRLDISLCCAHPWPVCARLAMTERCQRCGRRCSAASRRVACLLAMKSHPDPQRSCVPPERCAKFSSTLSVPVCIQGEILLSPHLQAILTLWTELTSPSCGFPRSGTHPSTHQRREDPRWCVGSQSLRSTAPVADSPNRPTSFGSNKSSTSFTRGQRTRTSRSRASSLTSLRSLALRSTN